MGHKEYNNFRSFTAITSQIAEKLASLRVTEKSQFKTDQKGGRMHPHLFFVFFFVPCL